MNIAKQLISYYDSEDFKNNYLEGLSETFHNYKDSIIDQIYNLFNVQNYETEKMLSNAKYLDKNQCALVYEFIYENFEDFVTDFRGYYVGYTSICSVSMGEQEEQLDGLHNNKTGKNYTLPYLKKVFENEGFFINGDYAYYNLGGGLHVDLLNNIAPLNDFLITI